MKIKVLLLVVLIGIAATPFSTKAEAVSNKPVLNSQKESRVTNEVSTGDVETENGNDTVLNTVNIQFEPPELQLVNAVSKIENSVTSCNPYTRGYSGCGGGEICQWSRPSEFACVVTPTEVRCTPYIAALYTECVSYDESNNDDD